VRLLETYVQTIYNFRHVVEGKRVNLDYLLLCGVYLQLSYQVLKRPVLALQCIEFGFGFSKTKAAYLNLGQFPFWSEPSGCLGWM
jgi:hypothetical protein